LGLDFITSTFAELGESFHDQELRGVVDARLFADVFVLVREAAGRTGTPSRDLPLESSCQAIASNLRTRQLSGLSAGSLPAARVFFADFSPAEAREKRRTRETT